MPFRAIRVAASRPIPKSDASASFPPASWPRSATRLRPMAGRPRANCLRFVMLTGCRPAEAMRATWEEFAEPGVWVAPSAHVKTKRTLRRPLSAAAIELIARIRADRKRTPRTARSELVFPGQSHGESLRQLRSTWEQVTAAATIALWREADKPEVAGIVSELEKGLGRAPSIEECQALAGAAGVDLPAHLLDGRIYDLRHSFASIGAGSGLSLQIIGRLLGHTQVRPTQRYAHLADDPLREAAEKIGAAIAGAGKNRNNVVSHPAWASPR
jgi:integrase